MTNQALEHIFTRDLSLFTVDAWYWLATKTMRAGVGNGFSDQIVRYTGRTTECYRLQRDLAAVGKAVTGLPDDHPVLSSEAQTFFRKDVDAIRNAAPHGRASVVQGSLQHLERVFPRFVISTLLPIRWEDMFRRKHIKSASAILKRLIDDRMYSEGILEIVDTQARKEIADILRTKELDPDDAHLVRYMEYMDFRFRSTVPKQAEIEKRRSGYVHIGGKLYVGNSFETLVKKHGYSFTAPPATVASKEITGTVAFAGGTINGTVHQVFITSAKPARFPRAGFWSRQ